MSIGLKRDWEQLKQGRPGRRFQERAERARANRSKRSWWGRLFEPVLGAVLLAGGVILCFIPGPGLPLIFIGAALLSARSRTLARFLDWAEMKLRRVIRWGKSWWSNAPGMEKLAAVLIGAGVLAGAGYGAYVIASSL
jgi:hypothetical protein